MGDRTIDGPSAKGERAEVFERYREGLDTLDLVVARVLLDA
ncbi:MAG: hypothetical protein P8R42_00970 [Candidatus Binatia bacterium]|nr:hypothetical protein [Candidatus Binatia bacterium]